MATILHVSQLNFNQNVSPQSLKSTYSKVHFSPERKRARENDRERKNEKKTRALFPCPLAKTSGCGSGGSSCAT